MKRLQHIKAGETEGWNDYRCLLNGIDVSEITVEADVPGCWVDTFDRDRKGNLQYVDDGPRRLKLRLKRLHGVVEIVRK